jgi:hypothetical protein
MIRRRRRSANIPVKGTRSCSSGKVTSIRMNASGAGVMCTPILVTTPRFDWQNIPSRLGPKPLHGSSAYCLSHD